MRSTTYFYEDEEWGGTRPPLGVVCPHMWLFFRKAAAIPRAKKLHEQGYITTSNKYHMIGKVDREDWFEYMNQEYFFGRLDVNEKHDWEEHYVRCYTNDNLVIPSFEYIALKKIKNQARW